MTSPKEVANVRFILIGVPRFLQGIMLYFPGVRAVYHDRALAALSLQTHLVYLGPPIEPV